MEVSGTVAVAEIMLSANANRESLLHPDWSGSLVAELILFASLAVLS